MRRSTAFQASIPLSINPVTSLPEMTRKKKARSSTCTASFKRSSNSAPRRKFYAVRRGLDGYAGVLNSWDECKLYVTGVPGAVFKSFKSHSEATAFLHSPLNAPSKPLLPAVGVTKPSMPPAGQASSRVSHPKEGEVVGESGELLVATPPCDAPTTLTAFTDGACINNGKPNSKAGYGVYFHALSPYNVSEPLPGLATNQRAEMTAMLEALRIVLQHGLLARGGHFTIYTDSQYTKKGMDTWTSNWKLNNWKTAAGTDVKNKDLWIAIDLAKQQLILLEIRISILWVKGHSGIPGNEAADNLATAGISKTINQM